MASRAVAEEFLQQKRIAVVGVSRTSTEFPNSVFRKMRELGYEVTPVNRHATQLEGVPCSPSVRQLPGPVDGVLVMVPAAEAAAVVLDCQAAGVKRVWLHRGGGVGAVSPEAVALAKQAGMAVVDGACPYMFLGGFMHKLHRYFAHLEA